MTKTNRTKAYSYLRFSTPEQMQGDSFRRQTQLAQSYAERHGLVLDEQLAFEDLGMSAYKGKMPGLVRYATSLTSWKKKKSLLAVTYLSKASTGSVGNKSSPRKGCSSRSFRAALSW